MVLISDEVSKQVYGTFPKADFNLMAPDGKESTMTISSFTMATNLNALPNVINPVSTRGTFNTALKAVPDDWIAEINFWNAASDGGLNLKVGAQINVKTDGIPTDRGAIPMNIIFKTCDGLHSIGVEKPRLTITHDGTINVSSLAGGQKLSYVVVDKNSNLIRGEEDKDLKKKLDYLMNKNRDLIKEMEQLKNMWNRLPKRFRKKANYRL